MSGYPLPGLPGGLPIEQFGDFVGEMLFTGKVTPKFTFVDDGVNQAYLIDHPMYGQLDSSSLEGVPAAALSILLDLFEYTLDVQNEFEEKRAEYRQAMDAFQRQRTRHLLRGKKASEPSTEALDSLVTLVKSMQDAIDKLVSLVFFLRDGIIDPETFDEAVKRLNIETLLASPIDSIVPSDPVAV